MRGTPGPWTAEIAYCDPGQPPYFSIEADEPPAGIKGPYNLADTLNRHHCIDPDEDRANAYLSASAPQLLHALKAMLESHGSHGPCRNNCCSDCRYARREAEAAIAKAEGKA